MPGEIALCDIDDACGTLYHALTDLAPIITLTWPPARQPSLGTEGGQPPAVEFQHQLQHMTDAERKWYLKQHEFTNSLQRCVRRPRYSPPGADHAHPGISHASRFSHSVSAKTRLLRARAMSTNAYPSSRPSFRISHCVSGYA